MKLLIALFLTAISSFGATIIADSTSRTDVSNAITLASNGDIVQIPAGGDYWTSTLTVTKAIQLIGAGTNSTWITNLNNQTLIDWSVTVSNVVPRISGISFVRSNTCTSATVKITGKSSSGLGTQINAFRVDHCYFKFGQRQVWVTGWAYGVIDQNSFDNLKIGVGITSDNYRAWQRPIEFGTTNAVYIENNNFVRQSGASTDSEPIYVYPESGARMTLRFNTFDGTSRSSELAMFSEGHGNQNYITPADSDTRSTISTERYGNTMAAYKFGRLFYLRGGQHLIYSNICTKVTTGTVVIRLTEEESWQTAFFNPLRTVWPAEDQITNSFFWANTLNGSALTESNIALQNAADATFIQQNRDWWFQAPNDTNGSPAGIYAAYAPLAYPHPLVETYDNHSPVISSIADQSMAKNGSLVVPFTITDDFDAAGSITPTFASSDTSVMPLANISVDNVSGVNWTITFTGNNVEGNSTITLAAEDSGALSSQRQFVLSANSVPYPAVAGGGRLSLRGR